MGHAMNGDEGTTPFAEWLRGEMSKRGYKLEGKRAGGITGLSRDSGVPQASLSRLLAGNGQASIDTLRAIGRVLGRPLNEMMVIAGHATEEEMGVKEVAAVEAPPEPELHAVPAVQVGRPDDPDPVEKLGSALEPHEWRIWSERNLTWEARLAAIRGLRRAEAEVSQQSSGTDDGGRNRRRNRRGA